MNSEERAMRRNEERERGNQANDILLQATMWCEARQLGQLKQMLAFLLNSHKLLEIHMGERETQLCRGDMAC